MIGKIITGKSFKGCLAYCFNDKISKENEQVFQNRAELLHCNKCFGNEKELVQQFNEIRQFNPRLSKPVLHITLSFAPGEKLRNNKLMEISEDCAKTFGFDKNQFIVISHIDTAHQHIHIIANRIGFDKKTVNDSNSYQKIAKFCRDTELKYVLKKVLNPKRFMSPDDRDLPRYDRRKELLKIHIKMALKRCFSMDEFIGRMKEKGYEVIKGRGICFVDKQRVSIKGSEVNCSLQTIERIIASVQPFRQYREQIIAAAGERPTMQKDTSHFANSPLNENDPLLSKILLDFMNIEYQNQSSFNFLQQTNRRKKKKRSLHL